MQFRRNIPYLHVLLSIRYSFSCYICNSLRLTHYTKAYTLITLLVLLMFVTVQSSSCHSPISHTEQLLTQAGILWERPAPLPPPPPPSDASGSTFRLGIKACSFVIARKIRPFQVQLQRYVLYFTFNKS